MKEYVCLVVQHASWIVNILHLHVLNVKWLDWLNYISWDARNFKNNPKVMKTLGKVCIITIWPDVSIYIHIPKYNNLGSTPTSLWKLGFNSFEMKVNKSPKKEVVKSPFSTSTIPYNCASHWLLFSMEINVQFHVEECPNFCHLMVCANFAAA